MVSGQTSIITGTIVLLRSACVASALKPVRFDRLLGPQHGNSARVVESLFGHLTITPLVLRRISHQSQKPGPLALRPTAWRAPDPRVCPK
jgi:hypothetical protein